MKAWTTPAMIGDRLQRDWARGRLLTAALGGTPLFPYRIPLSGPRPQEMLEQFDAVRAWIAELTRNSVENVKHGYRLEWRDVNHRYLGRNAIPTAAIFETPDEALAFIGKASDARRVAEAADGIIEAFPILYDWVMARPLTVLEWADDWPRLLSVVQWSLDHPRSGRYLRQVDVSGVDTKFIETHRRVLGDVLDVVLPSETIDWEQTGMSNFEVRYGFRTKPQLIRFRFLDPVQSMQGLRDLTVPHDEFSQLRLPVSRVFMVENEIEFLAFPSLPNSIVIFGAGYGLQRFGHAAWLRDREFYYWGDIDTHGFAILDELRAHCPHAQSLLMDEETLLAHQSFWEMEERPATHELTRLTSAETNLYDGLRTNRWGQGVRLEQEKISMAYAKKVLATFGL